MIPELKFNAKINTAMTDTIRPRCRGCLDRLTHKEYAAVRSGDGIAGRQALRTML